MYVGTFVSANVLSALLFLLCVYLLFLRNANNKWSKKNVRKAEVITTCNSMQMRFFLTQAGQPGSPSAVEL